jgi:hypothetical protein
MIAATRPLRYGGLASRRAGCAAAQSSTASACHVALEPDGWHSKMFAERAANPAARRDSTVRSGGCDRALLSTASETQGSADWVTAPLQEVARPSAGYAAEDQ